MAELLPMGGVLSRFGGTRFHTLLDKARSKAKSLLSLFGTENDMARTVSRVAGISIYLGQ